MTNQEIRNKVINKLLHKRVIKSKNRTIDTVAGWFPSHQQGLVKDEIDNMVADPNTPIQKYGGTRESIHLVGVQSAVEYLDRHNGTIPFGFEKYLD